MAFKTFINNISLKLTKSSAKAQQSFMHIFITFLVVIEEKIIASSKKICKNKRVCFNKMMTNYNLDEIDYEKQIT